MALIIECPQWRALRSKISHASSHQRSQLGSPEFHRDLRLKSYILQILAPHRWHTGWALFWVDNKDSKKHWSRTSISRCQCIQYSTISYHVSGRCCSGWDIVRVIKKWIVLTTQGVAKMWRSAIIAIICVCVSTSARTPRVISTARGDSLTTRFFRRICRSFGGKRGWLWPLTLGFFATWGWADHGGNLALWKVYHPTTPQIDPNWVYKLPQISWTFGWKVPHWVRSFPICFPWVSHSNYYWLMTTGYIPP